MGLSFAHVLLRLAPVLALVGLWIVSYPGQSYACSCAYPGLPSEALERSAAVFAGRVVSTDNSLVNQRSFGAITVEFDVSTVWKGPVQKTMRIATPDINNSCHFPFQVDAEYLVYSLNGLDANWCSPIRPLAEVADDLAVLGEGQVLSQTTGATAPTPEAPEQPAGGGCGPSPHADVLLVAGLVVGLAWLGLGKRNSGPH